MSEKKEKKKMKLWKKIVIGIVIVLVILLIAAYFIIRNMFSQPDIEAAKGTDETIVETDKGEIMGSLEDGVYQCHACRVDGRCHKGKVQQPVQTVEHRQNNQCTDAVKADVDAGNTFCAAVYADAGEQGSDTGTDVLSHDNGDRHAISDLSRQRQRL